MAERRPGRERKVYLRPEVDGALEAYREDNGMRPVNAILLELMEGFLIGEGYLLPRKMKGQRTQSSKGST